MTVKYSALTLAATLLSIGLALPTHAIAGDDVYEKDDRGHEKSYKKHGKKHEGKALNVQLGPRPYFLVEDMADSDLKEALQKCSDGSSSHGTGAWPHNNMK